MKAMDFRKIFDTIPEKFDKWRPKYSPEAFGCIIDAASLSPCKKALEIGPGTGQATEPILKTGCDYLAIELGGKLAEYTRGKFKAYPNFRLVNGDFESYDFGGERFDMIFSAAAIQWIPENIAFTRSFELLNAGGSLVMMRMKGDYKTPNEELFADIQRVYTEYFHPDMPYKQSFTYSNATDYGFDEYSERAFYSSREYSADDYIEYIGTHSDHLSLREPERTKFYEGVREAINRHGGRVKFMDTITVSIARKS